MKTRYRERSVLLSNIGTRAIRDLVDAIRRGEIKPITRMGWGEDLKRAAGKAKLDVTGIVPKMTRKTWVSWLMVTYPEDGLRVAHSLGHDIRTMQEHYLSLPFSKVEQEQIRPYVVGWGGKELRIVPGGVYIFKVGDYPHIYKIGATTNLEQRMKKHCWFTRENIDLIYSKYFEDVFPVEQDIHKYLGWKNAYENPWWGWEHYTLPNELLETVIERIESYIDVQSEEIK